MEEENLRFRGLDWFPEKQFGHHAIVGGCGGIGSWLCLFLAKSGYNFQVHDPDTIELHNLGGQFFKLSDIGRHKVTSVLSHIRTLGCKGIYSGLSKRIESDFNLNYSVFAVFSAFDNMDARKTLFNAFKEKEECNIFIDGRLEAENFQVFCVLKSDENAIKTYEEEYLFNSSEVEDVPCTMKQTSHIAAMIASTMVSLFNNCMSNQNNGMKIRNVPFLTTFSGPAFSMKNYESTPKTEDYVT